jgi:hypothetical protein
MNAKILTVMRGGAQGGNVKLEEYVGDGEIELSIAYIATNQTLTWTLGVGMSCAFNLIL